MRQLFRLLWGGLFVLALPWQSNAEMMTKTVTMDSATGQPYTLDELGAVVSEDGGELKVLFVMEPQNRPKGYEHVDLRAEDRLLMANGHKVTSIDLLKAALDSVKVGAEIQLGVKRDKDMLLVRYPKADPKTLPQVKTLTVTSTGAGPGKTSFTTTGGEGVEVTVLSGAGVLVTEKSKKLSVMHLLPRAGEIEGLKGIAEGDLVLQLQGKPTSDLAAVDAAWQEIAVGATVKLTCSHEGKEHTYTFTKLEPAKESGGAFIIK